ncbi:glycosyltransferase [Pleurocapsales cyanobacterium LEGE 06147]|nr:glycosyltransferase [Pleurocapsales cyanobacterium LEGE 06147]
MSSERIAFFLSELHGGGAQRVIVNLVNELVRRGRSIDLVLAKAEGVYLAQVSAKARIVDLKASQLIRSFPSLVSYLKSDRPKCLISGLRGANLLAIWAKALAQVETKVIVTIHNTLSQESKNYTYKRRKLLPYLIRHFYPWADEIVAVSQGSAKSLAHGTSLSLARIRIIYNPVVTPESIGMSQQPVTHPWFLPQKLPIILGVGRLDRQKDFTTLIGAFARIRQEREARLIILGEGEERPYLEQLVRDLNLNGEVSLPGFVENPYAYMAKANVFVLSSAWEGFGNVLVEAMACGTTVVSTNCESGPTEILAGGKYGKLVPVKNPEALALGILSALDTPFEPKILRSRAACFSVECITDRYLEIINA